MSVVDLERLRALIYDSPLDVAALVTALGGVVDAPGPARDYLLSHLPHRDDGVRGWMHARADERGASAPSLALVRPSRVCADPFEVLEGEHLHRVCAWDQLVLIEWTIDASEALWPFALDHARRIVKTHAAGDLGLLTAIEVKRRFLEGVGSRDIYDYYKNDLERAVYSAPEEAVRSVYEESAAAACRGIASAIFNAARILALRRGESWSALQQETRSALAEELEALLLSLRAEEAGGER